MSARAKDRGGHVRSATHESISDAPPSISSGQPEPTRVTKPGGDPALGWPFLRLWSEFYDDTLKLVLAAENRRRAFSSEGLAGEQFDAHIEKLRETADACGLGLGEHLVARLLGHLGDPVVATPHRWEGDGEKRQLLADDPFERNVAKLWAYCGHGDPARKKTKGMTKEEAFGLGSPACKMIVHLLAEACVRAKAHETTRYDLPPEVKAPYAKKVSELRRAYVPATTEPQAHELEKTAPLPAHTAAAN